MNTNYENLSTIVTFFGLTSNIICFDSSLGAELAIAKFAAKLLPRVLLDQTYTLWIFQSLGGFFAQKVKVN